MIQFNFSFGESSSLATALDLDSLAEHIHIHEIDALREKYRRCTHVCMSSFHLTLSPT